MSQSSKGSAESPPSVPEANGAHYDYTNVKDFSGYLDQYYRERPVTNDETAVFQFFIPLLSKHGRFKKYLDVGCGPTVHHPLMVSPFVETIHATDFIAANREEIKKWVNNQKDAAPWSHYAKFVLETLKNPSDTSSVFAFENDTRKKINKVELSDLMKEPVVTFDKDYDLVGCFYCLEEVAQTKEAFDAMINRVSKLIKPGGYLLVAALENTDFYHIKNSKDQEVEFPCLSITADDFKRALPAAGFDLSQTVIKNQTIEGQVDEGVPGVILILARKGE